MRDPFYDEDEFLPLSALQHLVFCPRQCALIHIEQLWAENRFTAEGDVLHQRVHEAGAEQRHAVRISRGVLLRSLSLGLSGKADIVEFHEDEPGGGWRPYPIEYKRGKPKPHRADEVQLCAQGMCLEEMLATPVPCGALFYGQTRRRVETAFDGELRGVVRQAVRNLHDLITHGATPPAVYEKKCLSCSLIDQCMPKSTSGHISARDYLRTALNEVLT